MRGQSFVLSILYLPLSGFWVFGGWPFMARKSMSLMDTLENDNEAFQKPLTIHFVQKQIDCDYSIN